MSTDDDVAARLALSLGRLSRLLRVAGGDLSHGLLSALATIAKRGPLRLAELAQLELVSAPSATRFVTELESRGLVVRSADPSDGRAFLIAATAAGTAKVLEARSARAKLITELCSRLSDADSAALAAAVPAIEAMAQEG